jgi:hypothetical protein
MLDAFENRDQQPLLIDKDSNHDSLVCSGLNKITLSLSFSGKKLSSFPKGAYCCFCNIYKKMAKTQLQ